MLIALGTGLSPHLSKAVLEGCRRMAGEFIRTPKDGVNKGRYRVRTDLPLVESLLTVVSFAAVVASVETGHYIATPFATLFTLGYGYVAVLVAQEQASRRRDAAASSGEAWAGERASEPAAEQRPFGDLAA
jgi:hypothetical protein